MTEYQRQGISKSEYSLIHRTLRKYLLGEYCVNCGYSANPIHFALIKGARYEMEPDNFLQLCQVCHSRYDSPKGLISFPDGSLIGKLYALKPATTVIGKHKLANQKKLSRTGLTDCFDGIITDVPFAEKVYKVFQYLENTKHKDWKPIDLASFNRAAA